MSDNYLRLDIGCQSLEKFCNQLLARSRDVVKTHESLITLETFIKIFGASQQGNSDYQAVEALIGRYTEQTRQQLLQQKAAELSQALKQYDVSAVTAIHTPLSRNGFYLILQTVTAELPPDDVQAVHGWVKNWTTEAKQKADQLSQYPDAPDFRAAGVVLEEYLAMVDVSRFLGSIPGGKGFPPR